MHQSVCTYSPALCCFFDISSSGAHERCQRCTDLGELIEKPLCTHLHVVASFAVIRPVTSSNMSCQRQGVSPTEAPVKSLPMLCSIPATSPAGWLSAV